MNNKANIWYFEDTDLFEVLCPTKAPGMEDKHSPNVFKRDEYIYFQKDQSETVYMISQGRVKVGTFTEDGKEIVKAILTRGELFGELALAGEGEREDFAVAMDDNTRVCPMTVDDLQGLMQDNQVLSFKILKLIGFRLKKMERKIESLVFKDARTRIVEFLKETAERERSESGI